MSPFRFYHVVPLLSVAMLAAVAGCEREEPAQYPDQQYQYPQQPYTQPTYTQPAYTQTQPTYTPAPTQPTTTAAPTATASGGQPSMIPGLQKMPDGTCQFTPPSLSPDQPSQPMTVPCPPGI